MKFVALALSILAVLCSATIWGVFVGAPLGVLSGILALLALRRARRRGEGAGVAITALVLSVLAILSLPGVYAVCSNTDCV